LTEQRVLGPLAGMNRTTVLVLSSVLLVTGCPKKGDDAGADKSASKSSSAKKGKGEARFSGDDFPEGDKGAKALLEQFLEDDADRAALTKRLRPSDDDYESIFNGDAAESAQKGYEKLWSSGEAVIAPKKGQTKLKVSSATTEDLREGSNAFPGGYRKVASKLKKGLTFYAWKFTEPGEDLGMAYDGLVFVNDHWVWVPKPWRVAGGGD
jgi:hypothetical protein